MHTFWQIVFAERLNILALSRRTFDPHQAPLRRKRPRRDPHARGRQAFSADETGCRAILESADTSAFSPRIAPESCRPLAPDES